jgi:hypothetical protein
MSVVIESTEYSTFLESRLGKGNESLLRNLGLDLYIEKAVCNEKCKHGLGRGFSPISIRELSTPSD